MIQVYFPLASQFLLTRDTNLVHFVSPGLKYSNTNNYTEATFNSNEFLSMLWFMAHTQCKNLSISRTTRNKENKPQRASLRSKEKISQVFTPR